MSRLLLLRHGQASDLQQGDYDALSPRGLRQSEHLGQRLAAREAPIHQVFVGPLRRHAQTLAAARATASGLPPETLHAGLDEHQGEHVLRAALAGRTVSAAELPRVLAQALRAWQQDGTRFPTVSETFQAFRARVTRTLGELMDASRRQGEAQTVAVFTSGGVVGCAVAAALELTDAHALELCLQVDNSALTELLFSSRPGDARLALRRFNDVSHVTPESLTSV